MDIIGLIIIVIFMVVFFGIVFGLIKGTTPIDIEDIKINPKKLNNINYVNRVYGQVCECERENSNFYRFECDEFFRGRRIAAENTKTYEERNLLINEYFEVLDKAREKLEGEK